MAQPGRSYRYSFSSSRIRSAWDGVVSIRSSSLIRWITESYFGSGIWVNRDSCSSPFEGEKDAAEGSEVFSPEIHSFKKEEIKRIGKNAGKDRGDDITLEVMFDSNVNEEEARELEELMKEF